MENFEKAKRPPSILQFVNSGAGRFGIWVISNLVGKMVSHVWGSKMVEMLKAADPVIPTRMGEIADPLIAVKWRSGRGRQMGLLPRE